MGQTTTTAAAIATAPGYRLDAEGLAALDGYVARFGDRAPAVVLDGFRREYAGTFECLAEWAWEALSDEAAERDDEPAPTAAELWERAEGHAAGELAAGRAWAVVTAPHGVAVFHVAGVTA